jgi:uncharacterized protein (TIGR02145 family)
MKNLIRIRLCWLFAIGISLIVTAGCKKSEDTNIVEGASITDSEGNLYKTVIIGTQTWIASDLKVTKFSNGDIIPTTTLDISKETAPKYQWAYANDETNVATYGRLYTWYIATDSRKICPAGWHVPTDVEWESLKLFLGGESAAGVKLKTAGTTLWQSPNSGVTNETGFSAVPGGWRKITGEFVSLHLSNYQWSSSDGVPLGWGQAFHSDDNLLLRGGYTKAAGVSIRCLKDI